MHDTLFVKIPQRQGNLAGIEFNFILLEPSLCFEKPIKLSSSDEWHNKEQSKVRHEQEFHAHKELMLALEHDVFLQLGVLDLIVLD